MKARLIAAWAVAGLLACVGAQAQPTVPPGPSASEAAVVDPARLHALAAQLRCLVCQNGSLADSHAPLALDLQREIARRMAAGESDERIIDFLVQRYGAYISYRPPWAPATWPLWLAPLLLLAGGGLWLYRQRAVPHAPDNHEPSP